MLNLSNVPGRQISGNDSEGLDWITEESNERYIYELSDSFIEMLNDTEYQEIPEDINEQIEAELRQLEDEALPKSTKEQMIRYSNKFKDFLRSKSLSLDFQRMPKDALNNYLRYFYSELRTKDGNFFRRRVLFVSELHCSGIFRLLNSREISI